jgi:hypothetical protein
MRNISSIFDQPIAVWRCRAKDELDFVSIAEERQPGKFFGSIRHSTRLSLAGIGLATGERIMTAGQRSGTGAMTELDDEKVRKDGILSNRDKAQRLPGQSLDGLGIEVDEYKDIPSNQRPGKDSGPSDSDK